MKLVQYVVLRGDLGWPTGALIGKSRKIRTSNYEFQCQSMFEIQTLNLIQFGTDEIRTIFSHLLITLRLSPPLQRKDAMPRSARS